MRDNDGRKLSKAAREQLRITAVKRVLAGESPEEVIKSIGFNRRCIYQWLSAYRSGGFEALKDNKNHGGRPPILSWIRMFHLYKIITGEHPLQYQARVCAVDYRNSPPIDSPQVWGKTLRGIGMAYLAGIGVKPSKAETPCVSAKSCCGEEVFT
jgi:transposase